MKLSRSGNRIRNTIRKPAEILRFLPDAHIFYASRLVLLDFRMNLWLKSLAWRYARLASPHNAEAWHMALSRGSVVALRRNGASGLGLVWRVRGRELIVLPIAGTNGPPRHRAEVHINEFSDVVACGVSIARPVIRCHHPRTVTLDRLVSQEAVGEATVGLMARVALAIAREALAQQMEERLSFRQVAVA